MTTRPSVGRQPPQRSLSTTNPIPRPSPHPRSLSQQYTASSPTRRSSDGFVDLTVDGDAAQGRPKIGMSRLRVEISTDSKNTEIVESPKPVSATASPWRPGLPPRGRPQLHFDFPSVSNLSPRLAQDGGQQEHIIKPMPLPVRPGNHLPQPSKKFQPSPSSAVKKDARPKPYVLEVPAAAPHYTPNGHADFFPWTGNHPEDQFSETVIKHGYYDKAQMTQNETGSARSSVFPALKQKSGLQTLSSLFTNILAQRRAHGRITTTSTFKPPPRVTVTDTKREMWLKDLANPTISLRRLSRSIPHGIRGKVLLDQSLSKNIPIERAVWLAKCVGANELRSFRRKGVSGTFAMGGEAKWIRDFTVCVEQFLESIIGSCGEKDFKTRINYAIRLATHFHAESLLDREHYMEWLVSSLENSAQAKLPLWLLITQIYWRELLQYRKHGRRLSAALLKQLNETLNHVDSDLLAPLSDRLKALIKELIISHPDSFVAPTVWSKQKHIVFSEIDSDDGHFIAHLQKIDTRNSRLIPTDHTKELSPRRKLIDRLDETLRIPLKTDISTYCWNLVDDKSLLVQTVLEWSTSTYRPGATKIFVAARILRSWSKFGADITGEILSILDSTNHEIGRSRSAFYHLISELSRSEHFSTSKYLQWLIARGGVDGPEAVSSNGPCATRLLAELPAHNLSESMYDLRMTLLGRANFSVDEEEDLIEQCVAFIAKRLPDMQSNMDLDSEGVNPNDNIEERMSTASRACKSALGQWLRQQVKLQMVQPTIPPFEDWDKSPTKGGTSAITAADFNTVRKYLELMDDYSMLADTLKIVSSSNNPDVLASCANTLDLHIEAFAAIGALNELFDILLSRLQSLTEDTDSAPRVFLVALLDLSSRLSSQKVVSQQLAHELARSDRKNAADACSPVSDHMAMVEDAEADFTDEIEKVLATGNTIQQATLERLFQSVTSRLMEGWEKAPEQQRSCGLLLTRLRTFDVPQFDILMGKWIHRLVQMERRPSLMQVCGPLISFGCLSLNSVITSCRASDMIGFKGRKNPRTSLEALTLLTLASSRSDVMSEEDAYRFRIKQMHAQKDFPADLLAVIRQSFEEHGATDNKAFKLKEFQELLQSLVLLDTETLIETVLKPLLHSLSPDVVTAIEASVDDLLLPSHQGLITMEKLFDLADDLSLPFCRMKLAVMFRAENHKVEDTEDSSQNRFEAFDTAIESAVTAGRTSWASIIPLLDPAIAQHLRQRAESRFLSLIPTPRTIGGIDSTAMLNRISLAKNLFRIIDATSSSISSTPTNSTITSDIATSLNGLWLLLANSQFQETKELTMSSWIPLLLSFVTIQASAFEATKAGHESRAKTTLALAAIFLQLQAQDISSEAIISLTEQTFDLALYLVDALPEEVRMQCVRSLKDTGSTPQIFYLFSFMGSPSERLILCQKGADGKDKLSAFTMRRWEMLGEPTPNVGENDTSLSLTLFGARRG